jgi:hypothetical protein
MNAIEAMSRAGEHPRELLVRVRAGGAVRQIATRIVSLLEATYPLDFPRDPETNLAADWPAVSLDYAINGSSWLLPTRNVN